jgi:hypothetical protein
LLVEVTRLPRRASAGACGYFRESPAEASENCPSGREADPVGYQRRPVITGPGEQGAGCEAREEGPGGIRARASMLVPKGALRIETGKAPSSTLSRLV